MPQTGNGNSVSVSGGAARQLEQAAAALPDLDRTSLGTISVLVAVEDAAVQELCAEQLRATGFAVSACARPEDALELFRRRPFEMAVLDVDPGREAGAELLRTVANGNGSTRSVLLTGANGVAGPIDSPPGGWTYLAKPFTPRHLDLVAHRVAHGILATRRAQELKVDLAASHGFSDRVAVIGRSAAFRHVVDLARRVAPTEAPVFITGESGCGKEQVAQFIHAHSRRSKQPIVAVNCAALPEPLLESEMFGHVRGAFTGAVADRPGLLQAADGGSLFLDELADMPVTLQAKLLRVIQDGQVRRVGSNVTDAVVDIRFIAATNRPPKEAIEAGLLRRDLYYRLRVVPIHIPPLRERLEDIPVLAEFFLEHFWSRHRIGESPTPVFSDAAVAALQSRTWRGNVRELQNTIEHAVVLLEAGQVIRPQDLPALDDPTTTPIKGVELSSDLTREAYHEARERIVAQFERGYLTWLIERAAGNMSRAARIAGVDRTTLYRLLDKHGLQRGVSLASGDGHALASSSALSPDWSL